MTQMPELVAMLHSFVGLAAVLVGFNSYLSAEGLTGSLATIHNVEVFLGVFIGAVTFTGSIVAFLKLSARIKSSPLMLPARHWLNLAAVLVSTGLLVWFVAVALGRAAAGDDGDRAGVRVAPGRLDRRRRHAGGRVDAQQLLRVGGRRGRLHARQRPAHRHRRPGRLLGCDPQLHHVPGDEPLVRLGDRRRLRPGGQRPAGTRTTASTARCRPPRSPSCSRTPPPWSSPRATGWPSPRRSTRWQS